MQDGSIDAAVQLIPLNFVAEDAGYVNLGEVSDHIRKSCSPLSLSIGRQRSDAAQRSSHFSRGVIEGTRWVL